MTDAGTKKKEGYILTVNGRKRALLKTLPEAKAAAALFMEDGKEISINHMLLRENQLISRSIYNYETQSWFQQTTEAISK